MKKTQTVLAMIFVIALAPFASAHEGHDHKIMGTVAAMHGNALDVKGTDGKTSTISLTDKTRIIQGTTVMKAADIKTGDRVVVTASGGGKAPYVAKEVRLGTAPPTPKAAPAKTRQEPR
jgi:hypothetical protein